LAFIGELLLGVQIMMRGLERCLDGRRPKPNTDYWDAKLRRNVERDAQHLRALAKAGWELLMIWDCETASLFEFERETTIIYRPQNRVS
jgi:G:T-mismatch repair DNA endonuclease (very short patch repair protein)